MKRIYILIILTLVSFQLIFSLHIIHRPQVNRQKNGFVRNTKSIHFTKVRTASFPFRPTSIINITDNSIIFENERQKKLYHLDKNLSVLRTIDLISRVPNIQTSSAAYNCDSSFLYILLPNFRDVTEIDLSNLHVQTKHSPIRFTRGIGYNNMTVIARGFDSAGTNAIFYKLNGSNISKQSKTITEANNDGGLSTDGMMVHDGRNSFYYMHFFKNEVLKIDTSLQIVSRFKTIDTITTCKNLIRKVNNSYMFYGGLSISNRQMAVGEKFIYILSGLKADNQRDKDFYNNLSIDVYEKSTGLYKGSIQIENDNGDTALRIYAKGNSLFVLFPNSFREYRLDEER